MKRLLERILHLPRRLLREALMVIDMTMLFVSNRFSNRMVTEPGGPVVSLSTYGRRSKTVYYAIESIARGNLRPSRLILWLDDIILYNNLPITLCRLQIRGLEVVLCQNYGPHKKYYPYVASQDHFDVPLVTADDDFFYPRYWLKTLMDAYLTNGQCVNAFWAKAIRIGHGEILPFKQWENSRSTDPSYLCQAVGQMGVIYPPQLLVAIKEAGSGFESCCPRADDIWLHVQALRAGFRVRQVLPRMPYFSFQGVPGTQHTALSYENVEADGNDRQIAATYNQADLEILRAEYGFVPQ